MRGRFSRSCWLRSCRSRRRSAPGRSIPTRALLPRQRGRRRQARRRSGPRHLRTPTRSPSAWPSWRRTIRPMGGAGAARLRACAARRGEVGPVLAVDRERRGQRLPPITGTSVYTSSSPTSRNVEPDRRPRAHRPLRHQRRHPALYVRRISSAKEAATAGVRVSEWDLEKSRQQARLDVRRAFYGLLAARDAEYLAAEILRGARQGHQGGQGEAGEGRQGRHGRRRPSPRGAARGDRVACR